MSVKIESLFNHIQTIFNNKGNWHKSQTSANKVCFNNLSSPFDEYVIEKQTANEISVSIPLNQVAYKKTFSFINANDSINAIIDYVQMHLSYYENRCV
jgi:hypothetical protein